MSVKPSARSSSSATYWGAMQMLLGTLARRTVVVSGGPSSASDGRAPRTPAAPASDRPARNSRRLGTVGVAISLRGSGVQQFVAPAMGTEHFPDAPCAGFELARRRWEVHGPATG